MYDMVRWGVISGMLDPAPLACFSASPKNINPMEAVKILTRVFTLWKLLFAAFFRESKNYEHFDSKNAFSERQIQKINFILSLLR